MYLTVLTIHSWLRWAALLLALGSLVSASRPDKDLSQRPPGARWDTFLMMAVDLQALFGLMLYFGLSPFTREAFEDFGRALDHPGLRFWAVEHVAAMVGVVVLVRVGRVLALSATTPEARRRRRLVAFACTTALMLAGVPWPGLENGRPLFRPWIG